MLLKTGNKIDGAIAANDNIAGAVVATLKAKDLKPIALSGQDATLSGRAEHHLGLADDDRLQVRADEANAAAAAAVALIKRQEDPGHQRVPQERQQEGADRPSCRCLDHEGELHEALQGQVPEAERRVRRGVQEVLQVSRLAGKRGGALGAPPRLSSRHATRERDTTPPAPRIHEVVRVGAGADRRRLRGARRRGHGARRRQRRRQVDAHQVHRRDPQLRLTARSSSTASRCTSTGRRTPRSSGSRSSTRISRSATTWTSSRTCTSAASARLALPAQGARDGAAHGGDAEVASL